MFFCIIILSYVWYFWKVTQFFGAMYVYIICKYSNKFQFTLLMRNDCIERIIEQKYVKKKSIHFLVKNQNVGLEIDKITYQNTT